MDYDGTFFRGAKSDVDPGQLPQGYYFNGLNVINQGGVLSCRPGYRCVITFPSGNLQGGAFFYPKVGLEQCVVVVDGRVFAAEYPFTSFRQLENLQFSPFAKEIFFEMAEQSATRRTDDLGSAIDIITPRAVLMMQDGGATAPAFYDGSESGHIRDKAFETPAGSAMKWIGDRLWVAVGSLVLASDVANPFSFREQLYLGGVQGFSFPSDVTALAGTPGLDSPQLLVFTNSNCSLIKANIRLRESWQTEPDMQREVFKVGASSQRSVVEHFGQLMWHSPQNGITFFDSALLSKQTARLPSRDSEMAVSKTQLSQDSSSIAGGAFGQYLLMSVPAGDSYNAHTWVLNDSSIETLSDSTGPSWVGVWTGTRPVVWLSGVIAGTSRIYHLSKDEDGANRMWEAFMPSRLDNGCPITWAVEFRGHFGQTSQTQKVPGTEVKFRYLDLALTGIEETLDIAAFYAGSLRGAYKKILDRQIKVARGSLSYRSQLTAESLIFGFKPESRKLRSQDVNDMPDDESGSCPVESENNEDRDESFQLMVVGHGPATIRWIRSFADVEPDRDTGNPATACDDECGVNAIRFDGYGSKADSVTAAAVSLAGRPSQFTSNKTVTLTYGGVTAVGVGFSESFISQEVSDRVACRIAQRMAENEIMGQLPSTTSAGVDVE
jgi:hypothetical protein